MATTPTRKQISKSVDAQIKAGSALLNGELDVPADATGIVLFAHGSGSSRLSPRNQYVARLSARFDAVLHFDETRAVEPFERNLEWIAGEVPETFPTGI